MVREEREQIAIRGLLQRELFHVFDYVVEFQHSPFFRVFLLHDFVHHMFFSLSLTNAFDCPYIAFAPGHQGTGHKKKGYNF